MKPPMMASRRAAAPRPARSERSMPSSVPVVDLVPWFGGDENARAAVAAEVDAALQSVGFFLLTGHGVPAGLRQGPCRLPARRLGAVLEDAPGRDHDRLAAAGPARSGRPAWPGACPGSATMPCGP